MNEWFKKLFGSIKEKWARWSKVQKGIFFCIVAVVIVAIILLVTLSPKPKSTKLFTAAYKDPEQLEKVLARLDQAGVTASADEKGVVYVDTAENAKKWRTQLSYEGLQPNSESNYNMFNISQWSRTSFNNKVDWKNHIETETKRILEDVNSISKARVVINLPDDSYFSDDQKPTTAAITLTAVSGSDALKDKKQIKGLQGIVVGCIEGILPENIYMIDSSTGLQINDFEGMAESDRLSNIERERKIIQREEAFYTDKVYKALEGTFTNERVRIANMKIEMDLSKTSESGKKYSGIVIKPDDPNTPYDDSDIRDHLEIGHETVIKTSTGTGFNPEGPAGVEGQNPPVLSDMSNMISKTEEKGEKVNNALNETHFEKESSPTVERLTVSVNIDGQWTKEYDEKTKKPKISATGGYVRNYIPIPDEDIAEITKLVQDAVGYNKARGDSVTVTNIKFDRSREHEAEDEAFRKAERTRRTVLFILIGVAAVLVLFIIFRLISREIDRRRRLREEEALRRQQAEREKALWEAKDQNMDVTMSVEERKRAELQENAIAMAKEHPEDVAMLIRTWLMEE